MSPANGSIPELGNYFFSGCPIRSKVTAMTKCPFSSKKLIPVNNAELCIETFGDPADPAILLIGGAASSMDWWETEFCERLAKERYVIRYDNRDTGESTSYKPGAPTYTQDDLIQDAKEIITALRLENAHIVGISMGGGIAQHLTVTNPSLVKTLTLIATTPDGPGGPEDAALPSPSDRIQKAFTEPAPPPDWSDRAAFVDYMVKELESFNGSYPLNIDSLRSLAGQVYDRTNNIESSMTNHWIIDGGKSVRPQLRKITAPTLVLHGTEDPLFPYPHGEKLAEEIPGAKLIPLEKIGHQYPPPELWNVVVPAILAHTKS
jgi:pimeloyl-ACP methyl ester carboxylesterase